MHIPPAGKPACKQRQAPREACCSRTVLIGSVLKRCCALCQTTLCFQNSFNSKHFWPFFPLFLQHLFWGTCENSVTQISTIWVQSPPAEVMVRSSIVAFLQGNSPFFLCIIVKSPNFYISTCLVCHIPFALTCAAPLSLHPSLTVTPT